MSCRRNNMPFAGSLAAFRGATSEPGGLPLLPSVNVSIPDMLPPRALPTAHLDRNKRHVNSVDRSLVGYSPLSACSALKASEIFSTLIKFVFPGILYGVPATIVRTSSGFAPRTLVAASTLNFTKWAVPATGS